MCSLSRIHTVSESKHRNLTHSLTQLSQRRTLLHFDLPDFGTDIRLKMGYKILTHPRLNEHPRPWGSILGLNEVLEYKISSICVTNFS